MLIGHKVNMISLDGYWRTINPLYLLGALLVLHNRSTGITILCVWVKPHHISAPLLSVLLNTVIVRVFVNSFSPIPQPQWNTSFIYHLCSPTKPTEPEPHHLAHLSLSTDAERAEFHWFQTFKNSRNPLIKEEPFSAPQHPFQPSISASSASVTWISNKRHLWFARQRRGP